MREVGKELLILFADFFSLGNKGFGSRARGSAETGGPPRNMIPYSPAWE